MRIIQSDNPRPLNVLAIGLNGLVAAASRTFGAVGGAELWDATTGIRKWTHAPDKWSFQSVAFVLNDKGLFVADSFGASLLDLRGTEILRTGWANAATVAVHDRAFVGRADPAHHGAALTCWGLPKISLLWKEDRWEPHTRFHFPLAIDPPTKRLAVPVWAGATHPTHFISVRDSDTGKQLVRFSLDPTSPVLQLAFTSDGAKLLVRTESNKVQLFDAATGAPAGELAHKGRPYVSGIAVHPRGPAACARTDGTVTFWDVERPEPLRTLDWKAGRLASVAFGPDGTLAAAGTEDGKIVVWDVDL
jgi:WD40 repeat protein